MGDSVITFESIFELVRKEKGNDILQELPRETYEQIVNYLKTKLKQYESSKAMGVQTSELEKIKMQIVSARKLVKELYERRERKILLLATDRSRTGTPLQDEKSLLDEEKKLFDQTVGLLDIYRKEVLLKLVNAKMPFSGADKAVETAKEPSIQVNQQEKKAEEKPEPENTKPTSLLPTQEAKPYESDKQEELSLIRFIGFVPKFLGKKMELFGPYEPGDMANLDKDIAAVLIKRGRAEEVKV